MIDFMVSDFIQNLGTFAGLSEVYLNESLLACKSFCSVVWEAINGPTAFSLPTPRFKPDVAVFSPVEQVPGFLASVIDTAVENMKDYTNRLNVPYSGVSYGSFWNNDLGLFDLSVHRQNQLTALYTNVP